MSCAKRAVGVHGRPRDGVLPDELLGALQRNDEQVPARSRGRRRTRAIDLVTEKPELKEINDRPVIKVTVDSVTYRTHEHTQRRDAEIGVYVAPMSVMDPNDPMAKRIGRIPSIPAG